MLLTRKVFPETAGLLQRLYRQSRHHQVRQRAPCLLLTSQGYKIAPLMAIFQVSRKTLSNWFNQWEERGLIGLSKRLGQGRKPTFNPEQIEQIRSWTTEHPKQWKQAVQKVQAQWDSSISTKTMKRVLKSIQMRWHRFRRVVGGTPAPQLYQDKYTQLESLKQLEADGELDLYDLNEAGFCLIPSIPYGWQPMGMTRALESRRSQRLNVLGLMTRAKQLQAYVSQ